MQEKKLTFKDRLRLELYYNSMSIKELSYKTEIAYSTLLKYFSKDSCIPNAEIAVKLAKSLNVTVEYLVTGFDPVIDNHKNSVLEKLSMLPRNKSKPIKELIDVLYDDLNNNESRRL